MKTRGFPYISIVLLSTTILTCTWFRYQAIPPIKLPSSPQQSLRGHDVIAYVAFSPNGKLLATASYDKAAKIWDLATGQVVFTLLGHRSEVVCLAFSPNSKLLATGGFDGSVRLWETATGHSVRVIQPNKSIITAIAFSPDGSLLAGAVADDTIRIWDVVSGSQKQTVEAQQTTMSLAFSPDGKRMARSSLGLPTELWDTHTWHRIGSITPPKVGSTLSLAFSPDGKYLAGGNDDMTARIWDAKSGKEIHVFKGHWGNVMAVAFSPDSKTLATGGDFSIKFWDMATGQNIGTITPKDRDPKHDSPGTGTMVYSLAFSPDGSLLAVGALDGIVDLWAIPKR